MGDNLQKESKAAYGIGKLRRAVAHYVEYVGETLNGYGVSDGRRRKKRELISYVECYIKAQRWPMFLSEMLGGLRSVRELGEKRQRST